MPELNVSRKNISTLFTGIKNYRFIIPDYQRPYRWDEEKCETLWNDIVNHFNENNSENANREYFLGTIVTCNGENKGDIEIIDGQQRVTSFSLLLRAFYKKLESMSEDDKTIGLKSQIAPCLWDVDPISKKVEDKSKIHIHSKVATESDNERFHEILINGNVKDNANDSYSKNYKYFYTVCEEFAKENPIQWLSLCVSILETCIILPIECEDMDTALTIFSTLNDRGMPLADADIFKSQIYRSISDYEERKKFSLEWKELSELVNDAGMELNDIFRFYSHYIRAKNNDRSKEIGLRKFYSKKQFQLLKNKNIMPNIYSLASFWYDINDREKDDSLIPVEARKYIQCLQCYPNEYWKYVVSVFYFKNNKNETFLDDFVVMIKRLTSFMLAKFVLRPTVNAIKDDIYKACIDIMEYGEIYLSVNIDQSFKGMLLKSTSYKTAKSLILLNAYLNNKQKELIPYKFEIEHIFPRIWQDTNYNGWNKEDADEYLEKFGNKVAIEKKVNIQAGNGYFGKKKERYKKSEIADVIELSEYQNNDWNKDDIEKREEKFASTIISFLKTNLTPKE